MTISFPGDNDENPYQTAITQGLQDFATSSGQPVPTVTPGIPEWNTPEYWIARKASRNVAIAMLEVARKTDVTIAQYEALVKVAEALAFD